MWARSDRCRVPPLDLGPSRSSTGGPGVDLHDNHNYDYGTGTCVIDSNRLMDKHNGKSLFIPGVGRNIFFSSPSWK